MKKLATFVLIIALVLSMGITASATTGFSDTNYHWAKDKISVMTEGGLLNGYPDGSFKPNNPITIAELCTLICQLDGYKPVKTHDYWAYEYIDYCLNTLKCVPGYEEISPTYYNVPCTRELAVDMIMDSVGSNNRSLMKTGVTESYIPDYNEIQSRYKASVLKAYQLGIVTGMDSAHTFKPKGNFTRAELCTILYQANHTKKNPVTATLTNDQIWDALLDMGIWEFRLAIFTASDGTIIDTDNEATYRAYLAQYGYDALYSVSYENFDDFISGGQIITYDYAEGGYITMTLACEYPAWQHGYDNNYDRFGNRVPVDSVGVNIHYDTTTGVYLHPSGFHYESRLIMKKMLEIALPNATTNTYELMQAIFLCELGETKTGDSFSIDADSMAIRWIDGHMTDMLITDRGTGVFKVVIYPTDRDAYETRKALPFAVCSRNVFAIKSENSTYIQRYDLTKW